MKKICIALIGILFLGSLQQVCAQKRKTTTRRTTTTTRRTTPQRTTTSTEKIVKEVAFYDVRIKDFCVDSEYLYYIEDMPNNAVMRIDRKTGEISQLFEGIANVYEGRRAVVHRINIVGGKFIFQYGNYPYKLGIIADNKYQGSDDWEKVFRTNGDYALITRHDSGTEVYDVKNMRAVKIPNIPMTGQDDARMEIDSNGNVWFPYRTEDQKKFGVVRMTTTGKATFFDLSTQSYVISERIAETDWFNHPINYFTSRGQYLYASCKRRIYRLNMLQPTVWEEYAKIPQTLNSSFRQFWPDYKGNILNNDEGTGCTYYFYRVGAFDNPQPLGKNKRIDTGITKWGWGTICPQLCKVRVDIDNNFIMSKGGCIIIYNPNGVVGYEKARGKVIEIKETGK